MGCCSPGRACVLWLQKRLILKTEQMVAKDQEIKVRGEVVDDVMRGVGAGGWPCVVMPELMGGEQAVACDHRGLCIASPGTTTPQPHHICTGEGTRVCRSASLPGTTPGRTRRQQDPGAPGVCVCVVVVGVVLGFGGRGC